MFTPDDVVYSYSRAQALADGVLVDISETAREAGFRHPVAITRVAFDDCVAWSAADNRKQTYQDESGRLWDMLWMGRNAARGLRGSADRCDFQLYRVPRDGRARSAELVTLKAICGPGDDAEPVVTIMLPDED